MNSKTIKTISAYIYRKFPEMEGVQPKVCRQLPAQGKTTHSMPIYLLTYSGVAKVDSGKPIKRWVRVVVNEQGKIMKISTSR